MGNLSVAEQQIVEIAKAVSSNASIPLWMNQQLHFLYVNVKNYRITEQLKNEGVDNFISHRLEDMYRLQIGYCI